MDRKTAEGAVIEQLARDLENDLINDSHDDPRIFKRHFAKRLRRTKRRLAEINKKEVGHEAKKLR